MHSCEEFAGLQRASETTGVDASQIIAKGHPVYATLTANLQEAVLLSIVTDESLSTGEKTRKIGAVFGKVQKTEKTMGIAIATLMHTAIIVAKTSSMLSSQS